MSTVSAAPLVLERVVVLGANGAMGAGSAAMFAGGGCEVRLVARDLPKVEGAMTATQGIAKSEQITEAMQARTYAEGYSNLIGDADLIFEAVAEDMALKKALFEEVDKNRPSDAIVATVSSGLSIREMCEGRSDGFKQHFVGIHLYNPPHVMTGVELIPHPDMDPELVAQLAETMQERFGRAVVVCNDLPAFAGNRIGFKVLNEVARLAEDHGVQMMDLLVGPYTGRALAPLATVDLVGWDVHKAIVDNVDANVRDEAPGAFKMPAYMDRLIAEGHLGDKTPLKGGFFKRTTVEGKAIVHQPRRCHRRLPGPQPGPQHPVRRRSSRAASRGPLPPGCPALHAGRRLPRRPRPHGHPWLRQLRAPSRRRGRRRPTPTSTAS